MAGHVSVVAQGLVAGHVSVVAQGLVVDQELGVVQGFVVVDREFVEVGQESVVAPELVVGQEIVHSLALPRPAFRVVAHLLVEHPAFLVETKKEEYQPLAFPEIPVHILAEEEVGKIVGEEVVVHKEVNWKEELGKQH